MTPTPACNYLTQLRCSLCSNTYQLGPEFLYVCPACGMQGLLDVEYDFSAARPHFEALRKHRQPRGLGRYVSLLPIRSVDNLPPILVGTPRSRPAWDWANCSPCLVSSSRKTVAIPLPPSKTAPALSPSLSPANGVSL